MRLIKEMLHFLGTATVLYCLVVAFMVVYQRNLLYFPDKQIANPEQYGLSGFSENFIQTSDGISVQSWYRPADSGMPTVIYYHGNASHMGNRAGIYSALARKGFGVLAVSYRGYGKSEGSPSEQGLYNDARSAIAYITETQKIPLDKVVLYGESLGTGVAVQMASEHKVGAVVLQAPYMSVSGRAAEIYFFVPVKMVIKDHFDSLSKIAKVQSPLMILHGELDDTIPIRHGKTLLEAANEPKEAVYFSDVGHNNFDSSAIAEEVVMFTKKNGVTK